MHGQRRRLHAKRGGPRHDLFADAPKSEQSESRTHEFVDEAAGTEKAELPAAIAKRSIGLKRLLPKCDERADHVLRDWDLMSCAIDHGDARREEAAVESLGAGRRTEEIGR